jgi:hypothetical protein
MRTSFQTRKDGSMAIDADAEAARVIFASVLFAARFHDTITPLVPVAQKALDAASRGRDTDYSVPPAQIRTGGFPASGSYLR